MSLAEKQQLFMRVLGELLSWIYAQGWAVTGGDLWRPDAKGHMPNSTHYIRLACDLNLFVRGEWQRVDCAEWQAIGARWKGLHHSCRWGGDFPQVDLNHVSIEHEGRS